MTMNRSGFDRRQYSRYAVDWIASIMHKSGGNGEIFHDRVEDISMGGAGIYSDTDIYSEKSLVMLIETPLPSSYGKTSKVITGIECGLCKPVFSEERQQFRIGVQFLRFHGIDKHLLAEALFIQHKAATRRNQVAASGVYI